MCILYITSYNLPEHDNQPIKNIESVADVSEESVGGEFKHHFNGENNTKHKIADLDILG